MHWCRCAQAAAGTEGGAASEPPGQLAAGRPLHQRPPVRQQLGGAGRGPRGHGPVRDAAPDGGGAPAGAAAVRARGAGVPRPHSTTRAFLLGPPSQAPGLDRQALG